jgi:aminoglycoside phosphotransferase (APT) family kinase protein
LRSRGQCDVDLLLDLLLIGPQLLLADLGRARERVLHAVLQVGRSNDDQSALRDYCARPMSLDTRNPIASTRRPRDRFVVRMHPNQLSIRLATVRRLVDQQFPPGRGQLVTPVTSSGTVNAIYRIGDDFVARFPLKPGDLLIVRRRLEAEADAARELSGRTRFATPEPVALGRPGPGYPLPWTVQTWLPGTPASDDDFSESVALAHDLGEFIQGVRGIELRGRTFSGSGRGGELRSHDAWMATCFERSMALVDVPRLRRIWAGMLELPAAASVAITHGDLIPGNVLTLEGRLAGVIDVGSLGPADPAVDLVAAWHLFEAGPREALRTDLGCGEREWARGRAWAFEQSMGALWYYADSNPTMSLMAKRTLHRILADEDRN